jgi:group I intron endonuclease
MGYIYKITNKIDSKIYIGQTKNDLEERWKQHRRKNSNCRYISYAFKKYGIDNFKFELICISFDEKLDEIEKYYIKKFDCLVPNGYNLREGGNTSKHNEETKKRISESLKGRTDFVRPKPQLGKPHKEETKNKISESCKGRKRDIKSDISKCKTVLQLDENNNVINKYISAREAARQIGVSCSSIILCCQGKRKKSMAFKWKYE